MRTLGGARLADDLETVAEEFQREGWRTVAAVSQARLWLWFRCTRARMWLAQDQFGKVEAELDAAGFHMLVLCLSVISGLVAWFFAYNIGKGRNWARIILAVLTIIGAGAIFLVGFNGQGIEVMLAIGITILRLTIVVFLFQKPSADWFKEMAA